MSYMDMDQLYKNRDIMLFREAYALEKIHGTSAHIIWKSPIVEGWKEGKVSLFPGGSDYPSFSALFNLEDLKAKFTERFLDRDVVIYGEVYGGKMMDMSDTYGPKLKFIVFEVKIGEHSFLNVPHAEKVALEFGLEFVPYEKISTDIASLDAERDAPSIQAIRNGMGYDKKREGIVLRPLIEVRKNNGQRVISKHKAEDFKETKTPRKLDAEKLAILSKAEDIAEEWATPMRLVHVLDKFPITAGMEQLGEIIVAMIKDIEKEAGGEVENFKEARKAIGKKTAEMFKERFKSGLQP
jgi:hypothetical protein